MPCTEALHDFVQRWLELELEGNDHTLTAPEVTDMLSTGAASGLFVDGDDVQYRAQLLSTYADGTLQIVGIAVLTAHDELSSIATQRLAVEVARHLLDIGDVRAAPAA